MRHRPNINVGRMAHRLRRGLSLVELMVGVTIGLFVVAAATVMVSGQLGENRRLLVETQLQQDLRATADIITRELRRVGAWTLAETGVSTPTGLFFRFDQAAYPASAPASGAVLNELQFKYEREGGAWGPWGFKLEGGVIKSLQTGNSWQDLTDPAVMFVDAFTITVERATPQQLPCPTLCPGGVTTCWPQLHVVDFVVYIEGRAKANLGIPVRRSITSRVRPRNDWVELKSGNPFAPCPS
jgi:type IV pilus assembly protein PilW